MFSQPKSATKSLSKKPAARKKRDRQYDDVFDIDDYVENQFSLVKSKINTDSAPIWNRNKLIVREIAELVVGAAVKAGVTNRGEIKDILNTLIHDGVVVRLPAMRSDFQYTPNPSLLYARSVEPQATKLLQGLRECNLPEWLKLSIKNNYHISLLRSELLFFDDWYYRHDYMADWLSISLFFQQTEKINEYLQQLEGELQDYCSKLPKKMRPKQDDKGFYYFAPSKEHPYQRNKILSGYLYEWAQKNGFEHYAKIISYLQESKFVEMLSNKTFFKDSAANVGERHGAWSHALQWYCVIEHHKKTKFLQHDPLELYQSLGSPENRTGGGLWDMIFDRFSNLSFLSPEYMTETLMLPRMRTSCPLLSGSVSRLLDKMQEAPKQYNADLYLKHKAEMEDGVVMREFKKMKR